MTVGPAAGPAGHHDEEDPKPMTTPALGTSRRSKLIVLAATFALMLSLLPFSSVLAASPTVTINQAGAQADPTNTSPINFTVVFSETVTGFATGDVLFTGSTAGGTLVGTVSGGPATYNVAVSGMTTGGSVIASVPAAVAVNGGSEANLASTSTDNSVTWDVTPPTVTINQAASQVDPTGVSPINFTVVFSETVTGFATGDVSFAGSTAGGTLAGTVTGSGPTYNVAVTGMTTAGNVVTSIAAAAANDLAGNPSAASTSTDDTVAWSPGGPSVTINQAAAQADPTKITPINFTVVFSATVTGFATGDVSFTGSTAGGTLVGTVTGSGTTYNVAVTGMTTSGTVVASVPASVAIDGSSRPNLASTSTDNTVTWDVTAPTVTIDQAASQADPTGVSPINFTVVFSEAVTGFATGDVTLTGSTAGGTLVGTVTGSGTTYNVAVTGMTTGGSVVATILAGVASDTAGNLNLASTSTDNNVLWDTTAGPTVTINQAIGQADPTGTSPINFTVVFSAAVTGFTGSDVVIGGTATGTKTVVITGAGPTYNAAVSGMTSSGTVIATIPAGAALGTVGAHPTQASTSTDNTVTFGVGNKYIVTASNSTPSPGTTVTISAQLADATNVAVATAGVVVTWSSTSTGTAGTFSSATSLTNASGIATVSFTVGTTLGTIYTVTATSPGPVTGTSGSITVTNASTLTLSAVPSITNYRAFLTLSAQFSGTTGGNRLVSFQRMTPVLPGTWVTIGTATSNAAGLATFSYGPPYNTQFRAVFAGAADLAAATSNTITRNVRYKVSLRPGSGLTTLVRRGTRITYTATVRPIAPAGLQRVTFLIYKRVGGVWTFRTSATVPTTAGVGSFSWTWSRGEWYIRARGNATIYNLTAYSPLAKVTGPLARGHLPGSVCKGTEPTLRPPLKSQAVDNGRTCIASTAVPFDAPRLPCQARPPGGSEAMTTPAAGTSRGSRIVVLAAAVALMLSLLPFASVLAAVPAAPSTPDLAPGSDTGISNTDNLTKTLNGLVFTGTAEVGSTVKVYVGGSTEIGSSVAAAGGAYSVTTTVAIPPNNSNLITATATNADGPSPMSLPLTVTTDTKVPAAPSKPDLDAASDTGTSSTDNITSDTTPTFSGTSEANATVELRANGLPVGSVASTGTSWTITSIALGAGTYSFTAVQTDGAGNGPSTASGGLSVTIGAAVPAPPSAPDLVAASDTGPSSTDNITSDTTPTFTGTAAAGSKVELFAGATSVGTGIASGGNWQIKVAPALAGGTYSFTATASNVNGTRCASPALSVTIQTIHYIVTASNLTPVPGAAITISAQLADANNVAVATAEWRYQLGVRAPAAADLGRAGLVRGLRRVRGCRPDPHDATDPRWFCARDGSFFYPLGENVAWSGDYEPYAAALAAAGATCFRTWICPWERSARMSAASLRR